MWQAGAEVAVGPLVVRAETVEHSVSAYALRISGPRDGGEGKATLAYSGDTDDCPGLERAASKADVFLCEASFLESGRSSRGIHLSAHRAGTVAQRAGVGRLVLTHIPPWTNPDLSLAEAGGSYPGPIDLAHPGLGIEL
jgi:ribonuclease BN (tRNA processing enzyme)